MSCSAKAIILDEIFDENSLPSEQEVRDYALRIGINPDTEKHLLKIALDGLMSPLPEDWKPCLDERINRVYYYNVKTQNTQWTHPLDEHFENLVRRKRQDESISAGDDDSKTSIKEDLKSFEEAVTTSEMLSSRNPIDTHKSVLTTKSQMSTPQIVKDPSPDRRKVLNPIGRPPLPPKRRAGSTSPKGGSLAGQERGTLSLRLSPSPSPTRIDIDSIGVPLSLPSPELKTDKPPSSRTPAIKLTGGGSAFLKSKQKPAQSPSEESKVSLKEPFEIVREAESIELPDNDDDDENFVEVGEKKLKHSASLGESGFEKFTKSKRFASLQESLLSLKNEMGLSSNEAKSPNASGPLVLRGILREKPSTTTKLWDVDPVFLTSEEKERLRIQELKDERKQNVRFADIINKPLNIKFSKSDSDEDSNTNDSSNDLDDLMLEHVYSDDEIKKERECNVSEKHQKINQKANLYESIKTEKLFKSKLDDSLHYTKESNKNILSRLVDLTEDSDKKFIHEDRKKRLLEVENNNKEESETSTKNKMNQNEQKKQGKEVFDNSKLNWDLENNTVEQHLSDVEFIKVQREKDDLKDFNGTTSPTKPSSFIGKLDKNVYSLPISESSRFPSAKHDQIKVEQEGSNENLSVKPTDDFKMQRYESGRILQKMFEKLRDEINSNDSDNDDEVELMQTSPLSDEELQAVVEKSDADLSLTSDQRKRVEGYKMEQNSFFEEKKASIHSEYENNIREIQNELNRQESREKERIYMEAQISVAHYKEEVEKEKNERETHLRSQCEEYLKDLEERLAKDKDFKVKKIKEDHETFLKEQEKKVKEEKCQFEEETKIRLKTSSSQLEKIVSDLKQKEENEILRLTDESSKKLKEVRQQIELEQAEQEKSYKQELAIVTAEYERIVADKQRELEKLREQQHTELAATQSRQEQSVNQLMEQHRLSLKQLQDQFLQEEELMRKKHYEKMELLNSQLSRISEKEDITQVNREFEKVRCEKRLLEEKYKSLKDKYLRLKNEVRLSMERKRQAKLNRQLQTRDPTSTTEDTTERSTDHGKPPLARRKLATTLSSDEQNGENPNGTPKTIKRRPKPTVSITTSSATGDSNSIPPAKPKNVWIPSPQQRREGASSAEDNHTSVSEEIQLEQDNCVGEKWTQSALSPLDNLRKQLEKLDDLEEQFPTSVHTDTYLRYPFSGPAGASCELEFYRHRLHLERESVRRAKQALSEQRLSIESRQVQLRHKQHSETLHQLHQEERELTDMEVGLHRTRALLGEKIIRLRYLEQSIERAAAYASHHSRDTTTNTNTDSSGFSGSDLDLSNTGQRSEMLLGGRSEMLWTENVLQSLENINSEIREIWTILGKQQVPGLGPPPVLNYENRAIGQGSDLFSLTPHRATDIADRTRRLKEWLIRTRDQQGQMIAPVTL